MDNFEGEWLTQNGTRVSVTKGECYFAKDLNGNIHLIDLKGNSLGGPSFDLKQKLPDKDTFEI